MLLSAERDPDPAPAPDELAPATRALHAAALGEADWRRALAEIARAVGGETGHLVGLLEDGTVAFALSGGDPRAPAPVEAAEPRLRAAQAAAELAILTEADLPPTPGSGGGRRRRSASRQPAGLLQCNLLKEGPLTVALSLPSDRSGPATAQERHRVAILAAQARNALKTRARLERQAAALLIAAMDYAGTPAFILGRDGRCLDMTPHGAAIVTDGDCLRLVAGRLQTARPEETPDLARAIAQVTRSDGAEVSQPRLVRASALSKGPPVLLEVFPAPPLAHGFSLSLGAVVVLRQQMLVDDRVAELARTLFGLTAAEARVAALMVGGGSVASIARERGVGFETARTHVRSILAKSGVRRQAEFVAKMCRYR